MGKHSKASVDERLEAVLNLVRREEPAAMIARRVGVSETTLNRWRDEFLQGGRTALAGSGRTNGRDRTIERLEREVAERDRVIGELTIVTRVFKKVSGQSL